MICTVAEAAVGPAGGGNGVVLAVRIGVSQRLLQVFRELCVTVMEPIDVLEIAVIRLATVGIDAAASLTNRLGEVISGVVGVLTGRAIQQNALALTV